MARTKATQDALADRMAILIAKGATQADAYRAIKPKFRAHDAQTIAEYASRFAARFNINARAAAIRAEMRPHEIYSVQAWLTDSISQRDQALAAANYNASQGYQRQIGQAIGAIGGDGATTIVVAEKLSDATLIARLAAGDPQLAAMLAERLGVPLDAPRPPDIVVEQTPGSARKLTR